MPLRRIDTEAPGRAQQNRFQLHMAGFAGSAPKGSSGRAVLLQFCLGPGCHSTPHPTQVGMFHSPVGAVAVLCGGLLVLWLACLLMRIS